MKQYVGFVRDHSISMRSIKSGAAKDYNANLKAFQDGARENGLDTILFVVKCGIGSNARVVKEVVNSNVFVVEPISESQYETSGSGTPLFDSVNELVSVMKQVPDANEKDVSFLVMVITDGEENASTDRMGAQMQQSIRALQATDRWTFTFRVPKGYGNSLAMKFGIPSGNISEWDQTEKGFTQSTQITTSAVSSYMRSRTMGVTSTGKFYADLSNVSQSAIRSVLTQIYPTTVLNVEKWNDGLAIKTKVESSGYSYNLGEWYYELTKTEKIQESKNIIVFDWPAGKYFTGSDARGLLNLPAYGEVKVVPGNLGNYKVYVQSTSVNRKLVGGSSIIKYVNR